MIRSRTSFQISEASPIAEPDSYYGIADIFYLPDERNLNIENFHYENFNVCIEMDFFNIFIGAKKLNIDGRIYELSF